MPGESQFSWEDPEIGPGALVLISTKGTDRVVSTLVFVLAEGTVSDDSGTFVPAPAWVRNPSPMLRVMYVDRDAPLHQIVVRPRKSPSTGCIYEILAPRSDR